MSELIDAFGLDWGLLLMQVINFGIVLFVLWYFLYKPLMNMIDTREKRIKRGVSEAEKASKELEEANEQKKEILSKANTEAERLIADGKEYAEEQQAKILKEAHAKSEQVIKDATMRGEEAKEALLRESRDEISRMVVLGAEKVLREKKENK